MPPALSFFSHTRQVCRSVIVPSPLSTNCGAALEEVHGPHTSLEHVSVCAESVPASQVVPSGLPVHVPAPAARARMKKVTNVPPKSADDLDHRDRMNGSLLRAKRERPLGESQDCERRKCLRTHSQQNAQARSYRKVREGNCARRRAPGPRGPSRCRRPATYSSPADGAHRCAACDPGPPSSCRNSRVYRRPQTLRAVRLRESWHSTSARHLLHRQQ